MNKLAQILLAGLLSLFAFAASAEPPPDIKALLGSAVSLFKEKGIQAASQEVSTSGKWRKGALYVVAVSFDGTTLAHAANEKLVGKNMIEAKDAAGKSFIKETIEAVKLKGEAQIDVRWGNPNTKQIADATLFSRAVPGQDLYVGVLVFKQ